MGDFYNWSHQCNWWGIKHLIRNCPTYDPTPDEDTFVDTEDDLVAEEALETLQLELWNRDDITLMTYEDRAKFLHPCFETMHSYLLCVESAWVVLSMDMCQVWFHAYKWQEFCGGEEYPCYCMNHPCGSDRLNTYNSIVENSFKINEFSRLPFSDWKLSNVEPVQKEWCDQHKAHDESHSVATFSINPTSITEPEQADQCERSTIKKIVLRAYDKAIPYCIYSVLGRGGYMAGTRNELSKEIPLKIKNTA